MTLPATTRRSPVYLGNGAVTTFPFTFKVFATTDIQVRLTSAAGVLTTAMLGTDYSVVLNADQTVSPGGTIVYPVTGSPLAVGASLVAIGNLPYDQTLALPAGGNFNPVAIERGIDRATMQMQQIAELAGRAVRAPAGEALADLPAAAVRANLLLSFDSTGQPATVAAASGTATALSLALAASTGSSTVGHVALGSGAVARTAQSKLRERISVVDFGAVADWNGTTGTDNAAAFNAAINYLFSVGGGILWVPRGFYRIASALNFAGTGAVGRFGNTPIVVQGEGMPNAFDTGSWTTYGGSWIIGQTGTWIVDCTGIQYLSFDNIGFRGMGTGASNKGILCARSTIVNFSHDISFRKCVVWIDTAPAATAIGGIAIANNGAETFVIEQCWLYADTPFAITFNNAQDLNFSSVYATIQSSAPYNSSTMMNIRNTTFQALTGYGTYIQGADNVFFDTCIWSRAGGTANAGIRFLSGQTGQAHCQDIRITGQVENFPSAVRIDDPQMWNIDIDVLMPSPTAEYVSAGGVILNNFKLNVHNAFGSTVQSCFNCSAASSMNGGEISVYAGGSVTANNNLGTTGTFIRGHNADVSGNLGLLSGSSYLAAGTLGVTLGGSAGGNQSVTSPALGTGGTISIASVVSRVNPAAAVTGVILPSGAMPGQQVTVLNESTFSITMAATATSRVADGVACVIAAQTTKTFTWDSGAPAWFHN